MRLLFLGDMVGRSGREAVYDQLPELITSLRTDFVIVNGENAAGRGAFLYEAKNGARVMVMNIMGRTFMHPELDDPFACVEKQLEGVELGQAADVIFIDFHAEATSEKQ